MIITANRALGLVSSHEILKAVPELLAAVEAFATANRAWQPRKGCPDCQKASYFAGVEDQALQAIASLPPEAVQRLKQHLGKRDVFINVPQPGKPSISRELK